MRNKELNQAFNFSNIAFNTLKKILTEELRLRFNKPLKKYRKHPKRHYIAESGHIQLDLKILGKNENGLGSIVCIFNMIETHSRLLFSLVLLNARTEHVLDALKEGIKFFKENGIEVKSIQADNAMMFKGNNFVHNANYISYLQEQKIIRRLIPLGQPQCNGCLERIHLTMDRVLRESFLKAKSKQEIQNIMTKFQNYYNNERVHYYSELEHLPYKQRYLTPKQAINSSIMIPRSH